MPRPPGWVPCSDVYEDRGPSGRGRRVRLHCQHEDGAGHKGPHRSRYFDHRRDLPPPEEMGGEPGA